MDRSRAAVSTSNRLPRWFLWLLALPAVLFVSVFFVLPVATLLRRSITTEAFRSIVNDASIRRVVWFTAWQAALSTLLTVAIGLVPAYLLARYEFRARRWVTALVTVPFVLPTVVVGAAFLALLPDSLNQGAGAIVAAHVFFNVAVVARGVASLWEQLPTDINAAARTLGASPLRAMREVTLPLLAPAIFASASIVFLFTFTSFGVVRLLGGPARPTLEVEIWQRATRFGDIDVAAMLSVMQLVVLGVAVVLFARIQHNHGRALRLGNASYRARAQTSRQRLFVGSTVTAIVIGVGAPLAALAERSLRPGSRHSLAAWRAVFGGQAPTAARPDTSQGVDAIASLATSLRFATLAALIAVAIGGCAALAIAALGRRGRLVDIGLMLPLGTSAVTIGFGLLITFDTPPFDWRSAWWMIPIGHALVAAPFVVRMALPVLRSIDPKLRDAALTLGASPARAWRAVDVRIARRALASGAAFALAISLGEFGATSFLTRRGRETLPIAIERLLNKPGSLLHAQGYVLATLLAALTCVVIAFVEGVHTVGEQRA